ncbi:MAG: SLATT domain-containing protein [Nitrospirales bacterium]|nr:SLATT domain-containing protein [Nitrospirales bacterium]
MSLILNISPQEILGRWYKGMRILELAHHTTAADYSRRHRLFGTPVVIVSTVVGTAVFATISESPHPAIQIVVGLLSITAGVLSSLQTFLNYPELAEKHKVAAVKYAGLRREIEQVMAVSSSEPDTIQEFLTSFRDRWNALDEDSPSVSMPVYRKTTVLVEEAERTRMELKGPNQT